MSKKVVILGSTGSVGKQSLEVCDLQKFEVLALTAYSNITLLEEQVRKFKPKIVVVADTTKYSQLKLALADLSVDVQSGSEAIEEVVSLSIADIIVNAISGIAGLRPTLAALNAGNVLALANKEALVVGGELVMQAAKNNGTEILPVDSEHSAIWQCLRAGKKQELRSLILTASGGPFFGKEKCDLENVSLRDTLAHPTWSMGKKITVDSATLMNKGLEFIEAMHLFNVTPEEIQVVVHPQSVIHSAVEFIDGSIIAQLSNPDMRLAIQYAITYPDRYHLNTKSLSLSDYGKLTFAEPDMNTFTCLKTCIEAAKQGGFAPCIANGANEEAVSLFLQGKISFLQIGELVKSAVDQVSLSVPITLDNLEQADKLAREHVYTKI